MSFWWIPPYGAAGAAWATLVAFTIRLAYVYVASQRAHPIAYRLARPLAVAALAVGLFGSWRVLVGNVAVFDRLVWSIPLSAGLLLAFPALLAITGALPAADRALLASFARSPRAALARLREDRP